METALNTPKVSFEDFYEVPNLKFDIEKLRADLDKILGEKKFNSPGVTHFGAIPLNQIPNDENSIKGNNIRGNTGLQQMKREKKFQEMQKLMSLNILNFYQNLKKHILKKFMKL